MAIFFNRILDFLLALIAPPIAPVPARRRLPVRIDRLRIDRRPRR